MMDIGGNEGPEAIQTLSSQLTAMRTAADAAASAMGVTLHDGPDITRAMEEVDSARNRDLIAVPIDGDALVAHTRAGATANNARVRPAFLRGIP